MKQAFAPFWDRTPTREESQQMAAGAPLKEGRVRSLAEVATILNMQHPVDRPMTCTDVRRIESRALDKIRREWKKRYGDEFPC